MHYNVNICKLIGKVEGLACFMTVFFKNHINASFSCFNFWSIVRQIPYLANHMNVSHDNVVYTMDILL